MKIVATFMIGMTLFFSGCNETSHQKATLLGQKQGVNPNSIAIQSAQKAQDRQNQLEIAKIQADAQVQMAKIQSQSQLQAVELQTKTQEKVAQIDATTKVQTAQMQIATKKESMKYTLYIAIAVIILLIIALILYYLNAKKKAELQKQLLEERLRHEEKLKARELEEQRVHKLLELIGDGKLPKQVEEEVIHAISTPKNKLIEG